MYASQWVQLTVECSRTVAKGIPSFSKRYIMERSERGIESKCGTAWWCGKILRLRLKLFIHLIDPGGTLGRVGRSEHKLRQLKVCDQVSYAVLRNLHQNQGATKTQPLLFGSHLYFAINHNSHC